MLGADFLVLAVGRHGICIVGLLPGNNAVSQLDSQLIYPFVAKPLDLVRVVQFVGTLSISQQALSQSVQLRFEMLLCCFPPWDPLQFPRRVFAMLIPILAKQMVDFEMEVPFSTGQSVQQGRNGLVSFGTVGIVELFQLPAKILNDLKFEADLLWVLVSMLISRLGLRCSHVFLKLYFW